MMLLLLLVCCVSVQEAVVIPNLNDLNTTDPALRSFLTKVLNSIQGISETVGNENLQLKERVLELRTEKVQLREDLNVLHSEKEAMKEQLKGVREEKELLKEYLNEVREEKGNLRDMILELKKEKDLLSQKVEEARMEKEQLKDIVVEVMVEKAAIQQNITRRSHASQVEDNSGVIRRLKNQLQEIRQEKMEMSMSLRNASLLRKEVERLWEENREMNRTMEVVNDKMSILEEEAKECVREVGNINRFKQEHIKKRTPATQDMYRDGLGTNLHRVSGRDSQAVDDSIQYHVASAFTQQAVIGHINSSAVHHLIKLLAPVSCHDWRKMGFTDSAYYLIDPDGKGIGEAPFTVYCDMNTGHTYVHHDTEDPVDVTSCSGQGCYFKRIRYNATQSQLLALLHSSASCKQFIKVECKNTPLLKGDIDYSWWEDRHGEPQTYWSGANYGRHTCSCGLSQSCVDSRKTCNCNAAFGDVWQTDQGYITNMSALPVSKIHFGLPESQQELTVRYTLGPLRCQGRRITSYPQSCRDLWSSGTTLTGYYHIGYPDSIQLAFCDMDSILDDDNFQEIVKEKHVIFYATLSTNWDSSGTVVFSNSVINVENGYNKNTGVFTAPVAGIYMFSVHAHTSSFCQVYVQKNGKNIAYLYTYGKTFDMAGIPVLEHLEAGDEVSVRLTAGILYGMSSAAHTIFVGLLLGN